MTNAFTEAAEKAAAAARAAAAAQPDNGSLTGQEQGEDSGLFGGEILPGLFNKFVVIGEKRTGIIVKPPTRRHATDMAGRPKYWDADAKEGKGAVVNYNTGKPLYDSVIVLQTEYLFTAQEIGDRNIDPIDVEDFKGVRGIFASGDMKKAITKAIKQARVRTEAEMVGMRLTGWRTGKVPKGEFTGWTWEFTLEPAPAAS